MKALTGLITRRRLTKKEWILLSLWIIIICIVFADKSARDVSAALNRLDEDINLTREKLVRLQTVLEYKEDIDTIYQKVVPGLRPIHDSEGVLREIENVNKEAGLTRLNLKPIAAKDEGLYKIYSVKIEVQDKIPAVMKFLNILTTTLKGVEIERLEIQSQSKQEYPKVNILMNVLGFAEGS